MRCHYYIKGCDFEALKWVWKLSAICTLSCYFHWPVCLNYFKNQQCQGQNYCICQLTPHCKPPWICSIGTCSWCQRNLQNVKKFGEICSESHTFERLKEAGCTSLLSCISRHSFRSSRTSLVKRYCVPDSESGAGRQNCSVAPNSKVWCGAEWIKLRYFYNVYMHHTHGAQDVCIIKRQQHCNLLL